MVTKIVGKVSDFIFQIEKIIVMLVISAMFVSLVAGVFYRYFLNSPIFWTDEFAIFCLIWMTFIGGSMSVKKKAAAAVTFLVDLLNEKARKVIISLGLLIVTSFCIFLVYYSYLWLSAPSISVQFSTSMKLPLIYPYLSVLVGFTFMSIHSIHLLLLSFNKEPEKGEV